MIDSSDVRLKDPLSEVTRNERKTLLGLSAIGIVVAKTGLVPTKISALGIEFDARDQTALLRILAGIIAYFVAAFLVYAIPELLAWRVSFEHVTLNWERTRDAQDEEERERDARRIADGAKRLRLWSWAFPKVPLLRGFFEFVLPILIGGYAIYALTNAQTSRLASRAAPSNVRVPVTTQAPNEIPDSKPIESSGRR